MDSRKTLKMSKTKKEVREGWKIMAICLLVAAVIFLVVGCYFEEKSNKLQSQFNECQEKVQTWTLEIYCDYDWEEDNDIVDVSYTLKFDNYEAYLEVKEKAEDDYCRIIS